MALLRYVSLSLLFIVSTTLPLTPIKLNPTIVGIMDGMSFGVDGKKIGAMYNMIRRIQNILIGERNKQGDRVGLYVFQGQLHSTQSLMPIEDSLNNQLKQFAIDKRVDLRAKEAVEHQLKEINGIRDCMLADFKKIVDPFMADARNAKEPLVKLIEDECKQRSKPRSMLLEWANLGDNELDGFDRKFTTMAIFNEFCEDLIIFLSDLIHNCKKGREQFEKMIKEFNQKPA